MPTATPGSERDLMLLKRRLEQIAVFTNKVMEDRMRARIINIEELVPHEDLPPCVLPGSGCPWALCCPRPTPGPRQRPGQALPAGQLLRHTSLCRSFAPIPLSQGAL